MRTTAIVVLWALTAAAAGCGQSQNLAVQTPPAVVVVPAAAAATGFSPPKSLDIIDLGLYQIQVPFGSISRNREFWQRIDESAVDPATHDLLDKNGVRVGLGAAGDWPGFKKILDAAGADTLQGHYLAPSAADQEIAASVELPEQRLFIFDRHGLSGAVYDQCRNLWVLGFGPSPVQPGAVRMELAPLVRATRRHFRTAFVNDRATVEYAVDEQLYDLNLRVDLPRGEFLVVAPSAQSQRPMSIGHQFLTSEAKPGRREMVLIFVSNPTPVVRVWPATRSTN